jgi:bifunctional DNA-binding transcriptional regulator/antitoxin component of YhaV-PrlF toxin-antitoxin module
MRTKTPPAPATTFSFVGNLGCIRFPPPIRKASGIKRNDQLALTVGDDGSLVLEKLQVSPETLREVLSVEGCACQRAPAGCAAGGPEVLTVGWSYVRLPEPRALELGLLPDAPLRLVGEPDRITVSLHPHPADLEDVPRVACPP